MLSVDIGDDDVVNSPRDLRVFALLWFWLVTSSIGLSELERRWARLSVYELGLLPRRHNLNKPGRFKTLNDLMGLSDAQFREQLRITKAAFVSLCVDVYGTTHWQFLKPGRPRLQPWVRVAIFLLQASSTGEFAKMMGILGVSKGSVHNYVKRVRRRIVQKLGPRYLR